MVYLWNGSQKFMEMIKIYIMDGTIDGVDYPDIHYCTVL